MLEATLGLEPRNKAFAEPSLTNLGTSPSLPSIIRIFFRFYKTPMLKEKLKTHLLSRVFCFWIQTLRIDLQTPLDFKPGVLALWHQDLIACAAAFKNKNVHVLVSQSQDGELFSRSISLLGYNVVRGSDTKGALNVRHLWKALQNGCFVGMAVDGPKGPPLKVKRGTLWLIEKSGAPAYQLRVQYFRFFRIKSWDRMIIPFPFSKIKVFVDVYELSENE